jgi:SRSO17 transposase
MDNPETLVTSGTEDTGWRQTTNKTKNTTQKTKKGDEQHGSHQKPRVNPGALEG